MDFEPFLGESLIRVQRRRGRSKQLVAAFCMLMIQSEIKGEVSERVEECR